MIERGIIIGIWGWLFVKRVSDPEQAFGWLRSLCYTAFGKRKGWFWAALWKVVFFCPKCHAGQVALWYTLWEYFNTGEFHFTQIVVAIFTATILEDYYGSFRTEKR